MATTPETDEVHAVPNELHVAPSDTHTLLSSIQVNMEGDEMHGAGITLDVRKPRKKEGEGYDNTSAWFRRWQQSHQSPDLH